MVVQRGRGRAEGQVVEAEGGKLLCFALGEVETGSLVVVKNCQMTVQLEKMLCYAVDLGDEGERWKGASKWKEVKTRWKEYF